MALELQQAVINKTEVYEASDIILKKHGVKR